MSYLKCYIILCVTFLGSVECYLDNGWTYHGPNNTNPIQKSSKPPKIPRILSFAYEPPPNRNGSIKTPQGSFYSPLPIGKVKKLEKTSSVADALSSLERQSRIPVSGVFKTYGRGEARIPYPGAFVKVPRSGGSNKAFKAMVSTRVFQPPQSAEKRHSVIFRSRRNCAACPKDEVVVATKGHTFVILPHPCSHRWQAIEGPIPGTKISEGVHYIIGKIDNQRKICKYRYEVKVRKCAPFKNEDLQVSCTAEHAWGSLCNFTCPSHKQLLGSSTSECTDDLQWSFGEPKCVENKSCLIPSTENGTKLDCETNEITPMDSNYLPEGTYCRIKLNGIAQEIRCKRGHWKKLPKRVRNRKGRRSKKVGLTGRETATREHCQPNPCLNGGTCLFSAKTYHSTHICHCRPSTEGPRCEFIECAHNPCQNGGKCLQVNEDKNCFCPPNFTGQLCEQILK